MQEEKHNNNYISLRDATRLCNHSQEYLSLRARQGKLKAVKFGRNWVTTKEWFEEYIGKAIAAKQPILPSPPKFFGEKFRRASPPDNLPIEKFRLNLNLRELRPAFAFALAFVLIMAGGVFGKESFVKTYNDLAPIVQKIEQRIEQGIDKGAQFGLAAIEVIGDQEIPIDHQFVTVRETSKGIMGILKDYGQWSSGKILSLWQRAKNTPIARSYVAADNFVEDKLFSLLRTVLDNYLTANDFVEKKISTFLAPISQGYLVANDFIEESVNKFIEEGYRLTTKPFIKVYQLVTAFWKGLMPGKEFLVVKEKLEALKSEFEKFKEEPVVVKRIEVSKVVEPVKEITREVEKVQQITKIDDEALKQVRANMAYLEEEIGKRLYAPGGVISQTIYVTEPVSSPKIYQENGEIVLQTLGSGNVILSAATGLQLYGQQVVIESTSLLNPLVYIASKTRIGGDLTVTGSIAGGALSVSSVTASGNASVGGNLTVSGNLTISGDFTVSGAQTYSGAASFTASSTSPVLTVRQNGSGLVAQFLDSSGTSLFRIANDGSVTSNATITAASFASAATDSTVRKSGEEVFREIVPISRYDIPAQTGTTTYFRISKSFDQNPLSSTPTQLPGATRVYKLIIKYADNIPANSSSSWRIYRPAAVDTVDTFVLLGQGLSSVAEGIATTTKNLTIPDNDWRVDVKLSEADSGKTLRIFQIFLLAFDKIN